MNQTYRIALDSLKELVEFAEHHDVPTLWPHAENVLEGGDLSSFVKALEDFRDRYYAFQEFARLNCVLVASGIGTDPMVEL